MMPAPDASGAERGAWTGVLAPPEFPGSPPVTGNSDRELWPGTLAARGVTWPTP